MATTILAVDDSASIRQMLAFALRSAGYQVLEAVDGMDALEMAKINQIDMVLTDLHMPRMDGLALAKYLRGIPMYVSVPVLMLTMESSDAMKSQGRDIGVTGWLVKPFDPQTLVGIVHRIINRTGHSASIDGHQLEQK